MALSKLNLGCGVNLLPGYVNVDKFGEPDLRHDLETFPWPWPDNSVEEIRLQHVLEHLGASTDTYFGIVKEMYRVCAPGALIHIVVPHPRHDDFLSDPTHVRAVTPDGWGLFSKAKNREWVQAGHSNTPLAMYLDVDFEVVSVRFNIEPAWMEKLTTGAMSEADIHHALRTYNNVATEIVMVLKVVK